ncbi:MAG: PAS domain S-box protein, partial [Deltaproteobacteria bacterium]|nr:PAS domain S-box protein [Deltaproteobacteria bacterium]
LGVGLMATIAVGAHLFERTAPSHLPLDVLLGLCFALFVWLAVRREADERRLAASELLHRSILESMGDGVFVLNSHGIITACNRAAAHILGFEQNELVGKPLGWADAGRVTTEGDTVDAQNGPSLRTLRTGQAFSEEIVGVRLKHTGELRWLSISSRPLVGPNRDTAAVVATFTDVTEQRAAEDFVTQQRVKLVTASKMSALGEMATALGHEINNPLAIIHGKAGQLREMAELGDIDPALVAKQAERIEATANRIAKIVRSLRTFARDGAGDDFVATPIRSIIEETLELCQERLHKENIKLLVDPFPDTLTAECRPTQIAQVLLNLMMNARDAVGAQPERWIRVTVTSAAGAIVIAVSDSGPGIPPEVRDRIFDPFFTTKEVGKGTGLGLSVSRGVMRGHNGSLSLDTSSPNTRFLIQFPQDQSSTTQKKEAA